MSGEAEVDDQHEVTMPVERRAMTLALPLLGLRPYVLLEFFDGGEDDDDLRINLSAGGGIGTTRDIRAALQAALANLPQDGPDSEEPSPPA